MYIFINVFIEETENKLTTKQTNLHAAAAKGLEFDRRNTDQNTLVSRRPSLFEAAVIDSGKMSQFSRENTNSV